MPLAAPSTPPLTAPLPNTASPVLNAPVAVAPVAGIELTIEVGECFGAAPRPGSQLATYQHNLARFLRGTAA